MKKLLVAAIMVVLATPAFAAIQNVKVSGDITTTYVDRDNFDLGQTESGLPDGLKKQSVVLTQTRLRVDADLSDNVSTTVGLINERVWNAENAPSGVSYGAYDTNVQLYLASVTMRELLYSPLTVTVGRQVFNYGNGFIMGDGGPINQGTGPLANIAQDLNMRTAYDGVKAILDYKPLTIDLIYFKNGQTSSSITGGYVSNPNQSSDVYGYNLNYQLSDPMNTVIEQYMFARINGSGSGTGIGSSGDAYLNEGKGTTLFVPGLRASTNPIKGLNVQGEVAWQLGQQSVQGYINPNSPTYVGTDSEHRDAMAGQVMATYSLPVLEKYKPSVNASYTYVSGDKDAVQNADSTGGAKIAKTYSAWDEFNTIQGAGTIYRTILPMSNENIIAVGASANPLEDVTTSFTWSNLWSAVKNDNINNPLAIYQPNGSNITEVVVPITNTKKDARGLGNEYDVAVSYNYTEDVTFGVSLGWFVAGSELDSTNRGTASQAMADLAVKF